MKRLIFSTVAAMLALAAASANAGDLDAIMADCNGCHGPGGVSESSDVPTIAGFPEFVHVDALYAYAEKARPCASSKYRHGDTARPAKSMCEIAAELSEGDIDAVAAAYAALDYVKVKQEFDASLVGAGKALHDEHCDKCHSEAGTNAEDEAGMMGGQMMGYLETTMAQFMDGSRDQPKKMKEKMDLLSADDVKALVHYYGSVQ